MDFSKLIGWLGFSFGLFISVPQVIKSIRIRSTQGVSKLTYILLFLACICYVVRAMAIKETIFIVSNAFQIVVAGTMLCLMRKYKGKETTIFIKSPREINKDGFVHKEEDKIIFHQIPEASKRMCDHLGYPNPEDSCPCGFYKGSHLHTGTDGKKHLCHTQGCEICNSSISHIKKINEDLNVKT